MIIMRYIQMKDLPKEIINWDINILEYLKKHKKH